MFCLSLLSLAGHACAGYLVKNLFVIPLYDPSVLLFLRCHSQGQESIHFQDVLCQMIDMVAPKNPLAITLEDMVKPNKRMICGTYNTVLTVILTHPFLPRRVILRDA